MLNLFSTSAAGVSAKPSAVCLAWADRAASTTTLDAAQALASVMRLTRKVSIRLAVAVARATRSDRAISFVTASRLRAKLVSMMSR